MERPIAQGRLARDECFLRTLARRIAGLWVEHGFRRFPRGVASREVRRLTRFTDEEIERHAGATPPGAVS